MGIESEQLVYDYLSRVGDLAQQRQLPSGDRMRLVTRLREEIERQRSRGADSPGAVQRILGRLGDPDELVEEAGGRSGERRDEADVRSPLPSAPRAVPPSDPDETVRRPAPRRTFGGLVKRGGVPAPRTPRTAFDDLAPGTASPPHLAGEDELGPPRTAATDGPDVMDWWRVEPGPFGARADHGLMDQVPGFVGGIEIPELLKPPPKPGTVEGDPVEKAVEGRTAVDGDKAAQRGNVLRRALRSRRAKGTAEEKAVAEKTVVEKAARPSVWRGSPLLLLAAALLLAGAALGSWIALALGWLLAYVTRRLTRMEAKWAVLGLPGLVAAGAVGWFWGRVNERWGDPIPRGHLGETLTGSWPVVLRTAAVASALFLVWRARRR